MKGRRIIPLAATAALVIGASLAVAPSAHADWEGTITGKVVNPDGTPANDVRVVATGADDGNPATDDGDSSGYTDRNGVYRVDIERNNTYSLTLDGLPAVPAQNATGTAGAVTTGPTFTLPVPTPVAPAAVPADYSAVISVTGGVPAKTTVRVQNQTTGDTSATGTLATDGRFYFTGLTAGSYKVMAYGYNGSNNYLGTIFSGGTLSKRDATVVTIGDKTDLGTLSLPTDQLDGSITGHVAVPRVAGFDEWSAQITFYSMDGKGEGIWGGYANVDAAGNFSGDVSPGTYYASAVGYGEKVTNFAALLNGTFSTNHVNTLAFYSTPTTWYGSKDGTFVNAKKIVVAPNGTVSGINFNLTNTLTPIAKPMIKGKFKQGKKISVTPGTWNQSDDLTFTYMWKEGSKVLGTGSSLKLSKKVWKKAKKLSVSVTAHDKTGSLFDGTVNLPVAKTIKAQIKAAKKQLKQDTKKDNKAIKQASHI